MIPGIPPFLDLSSPPKNAYRPCKVQLITEAGKEAVLGPQRYLFHRTDESAILGILRDKQVTATPQRDQPGEPVSFSTTMHNVFPLLGGPTMVFHADRLYAMNDTLGPLCYIGDALTEAREAARKNPRFMEFLREQMAMRGSTSYSLVTAIKTVFKTYDLGYADEYEWIANGPVRFTREAVAGVVSTLELRVVESSTNVVIPSDSSQPTTFHWVREVASSTNVMTDFSQWKRTLTRILTAWVTARAFPTAWTAVVAAMPSRIRVPQGLPEKLRFDVPLLSPPDPYWYWARVFRAAKARGEAPPPEHRDPGYTTYYFRMPPERWARVADAIDPLSELPFSELAPRFLGVAEINRIRYDISHGAVRP